MADDTITVTHKPSCACHCGEYKQYTKTYKNYCPRCKKSGLLTDSPKRTVGPEGEISCNTANGGCGADYCGVCGGEKTGTVNGVKSCSKEEWKLTPADGSETNDDDEGETESEATYDDMIKDLIKPLDGEVEYKIRGDKCYINKIPFPEENCELWIREGVNITSDGVTISDYNPDTPNFFVISWGEEYDKQFVIKIPKLIERFGPKIVQVNAVKKVLKWTLEEGSSSESSDSGDVGTGDSTSTSDTTSTNSSGSSSSSSSSRNSKSGTNLGQGVTVRSNTRTSSSGNKSGVQVTSKKSSSNFGVSAIQGAAALIRKMFGK